MLSKFAKPMEHLTTIETIEILVPTTITQHRVKLVNGKLKYFIRTGTSNWKENKSPPRTIPSYPINILPKGLFLRPFIHLLKTNSTCTNYSLYMDDNFPSPCFQRKLS